MCTYKLVTQLLTQTIKHIQTYSKCVSKLYTTMIIKFDRTASLHFLNNIYFWIFKHRVRRFFTFGKICTHIINSLKKYQSFQEHDFLDTSNFIPQIIWPVYLVVHFKNKFKSEESFFGFNFLFSFINTNQELETVFWT